MTSWETCATCTHTHHTPAHHTHHTHTTHRYHPPQQVKICSTLSASSTATHTHTYTHICTHARTHTHMHTHMHTQTHTHNTHTHHPAQQVKTCLTLCNWLRREVLAGTEIPRGCGWVVQMVGDRKGRGTIPNTAPSPPEFLHLVLH